MCIAFAIFFLVPIMHYMATAVIVCTVSSQLER